MAWVSDDEIVTSFHADQLGWSDLWTFNRASGRWKMLLEAKDLACSRVDFFRPVSIRPGEGAYERACHAGGLGPAVDRSIRSVDWRTGRSGEFVPGPLPFTPGQFTWSVEFDRGFYGEVADPCVSIAGVTREGHELLPITIPAGDKTWRLDELYRRPEAECGGRASWPAWEPGGRRVAFFASPQGETEWGLYVMDGVRWGPRQILGSIGEPQGLRWSPDGQKLAFRGRFRNTSGIWVFDLEERVMTLISTALIADLDWSPDGRQIVAVAQLLDRAFRTELVVFTVRPSSELVSSISS